MIKEIVEKWDKLYVLPNNYTPKKMDDATDIIPAHNNPIKFVCAGFPCPALLKQSIDYMCEYAQMKIEDNNLVIYCGEKRCEKNIGIMMVE